MTSLARRPLSDAAVGVAGAESALALMTMKRPASAASEHPTVPFVSFASVAFVTIGCNCMRLDARAAS